MSKGMRGVTEGDRDWASPPASHFPASHPPILKFRPGRPPPRHLNTLPCPLICPFMEQISVSNFAHSSISETRLTDISKSIFSISQYLSHNIFHPTQFPSQHTALKTKLWTIGTYESIQYGKILTKGINKLK